MHKADIIAKSWHYLHAVFKVIKYCIITSHLEPSRTFVYFNPKMCGIIYVGAGKFAESVVTLYTHNRHANSRVKKNAKDIFQILRSVYLRRVANAKGRRRKRVATASELS